MSSSKFPRQPFVLLRNSLRVIGQNPEVLYPYVISVFIQLLILEILYFAPREPLVNLFGPIIARLRGEAFLHYPMNFIWMADVFHKLQIPLYVFCGAFFISVSVGIVHRLNQGQKVVPSRMVGETLLSYVHIFVVALVIALVVFGLAKGYGTVIQRAQLIRSTTGKFYILKQTVLLSAPYIYLVISVWVSAVFAFLYPLIVIERKKALSALVINFKRLRGSFWFLFWALLLPTLFYLPVLLLMTNPQIFQDFLPPEASVLILIAEIFVLAFINAVQYTCITMTYLYLRETS